jgi:hypothetical protein
MTDDPVSERYVIEILEGDRIDPNDDNVDVFVYFPDGRKYVATFFTVSNIQTIMDKDRTTGECANGLYFWASHMIIVQRLDHGTVARTVSDLISTGEFDAVFEGPHPTD